MMSSLRTKGMFALLWLTFAVFASGGPITGNVSVTGHTYNVDNGGRYALTFNGGSAISVFCVDFQNATGTTYDAYLSDASDLSFTRFGTTPASGFAWPVGQTFTVMDRYVMAAWLTTQYDYSGVNGSGSPVDLNNRGIQNAIWTLLTQTGVFQHTDGNQAAWIANAIAFTGNAALYGTIQSEMRIITDVSVAGRVIPYRYGVPPQEMIFVMTPGFTPILSMPEPTSFLLLGAGLLALGAYRRKSQARQG